VDNADKMCTACSSVVFMLIVWTGVHLASLLFQICTTLFTHLSQNSVQKSYSSNYVCSIVGSIVTSLQKIGRNVICCHS